MTADWRKSRQTNNPWGHYFFFIMIRFGGRRLAYFFLYFVVLVYALFFPSVKKKCIHYLSRRFPDAGRIKQAWHRYCLVLNLGKVLVDRAVLGILGEGSLKAGFKNIQDFYRIKALDSGFIILVSHVGCWQVAMSALSRLDRPVSLVMIEPDREIDKHYYTHRTGKKQFDIINPEQFLGGALEMLDVLKKDEILCIMGDRVFGNTDQVVEMKFLGDNAFFPFTPYRLASISQKPVVILNSFKSSSNAYQLALSGIIHIPSKLGKSGQNYQTYAQAYVNALQAFVSTHPYQFFNFYDMWTVSTFHDT
ncbi:MAG: lysophospholipid acyltransferase family protein [Desulfobacteraceae bacterium]|nr:lysophospholipid acyltransferase family protein [Desulfobacteraceae bacterium]